MTPNKIAQARAMYDDGKHTVQQIADTFGVSRPTICRHLGTAPPAPPKPAADTKSAQPAEPAEGGSGPARRRAPVAAQQEAS